jgi:uncharacterized protein DUF5685
MLGIVRPCRHRLSAGLFGEWTAHLCGLCLALRDLHGQAARLVINYDGDHVTDRDGIFARPLVAVPARLVASR